MGKMNAAEAIVEVMLREEVEKAFCVPGESYLNLLDAIKNQPKIELISGRHEGGISFMTEGYAKASGKVGVCMATRGPGATNLSIGLHTAKQDSTPVVAFIGQVEREFRGREGFQEINLAEYFSQLVKWTVELTDPSRTVEIVQRAFHVAKTGRPGPVLVSLPQDVLDEMADVQLQKSTIFSQPRAESTAVFEAKKLLESADRPAIIAGGGITSTKSAKQLIELAEKLHAPVITAFRRFDAFPNDHSHYVGALGLGTSEYIVDLVQDSDVVLALGTRFSQITTQNYTLISPGTKLIHIDISAEELNKVYPADLGAVSDVKQFMTDLIMALDGGTQHSDPRNKRLIEARSKYEQISSVPDETNTEFVDLGIVISHVMSAVPKETMITSDAGNFFGWLSRYYKFTEEGTYIGPTSGAMGYGLPAAIGAKIAHPDQTVIAFCGDGGFMMTSQELETAVRNNVPVIAIIANNNMYGTIRMHQEKHFPRRVIGTNLTNPNFRELIEAMGGHGELVLKNEGFPSALQRAMDSGKPSVIEVRTDPEQITVSKTIGDLRELNKN